MRNKNAGINEVSDFITNSGEEFRITYSAKKLPNGIIRLTESDCINIKDEINSYKDSCDLSILVDRIYRGDTSLLGNPDGMYYGDATRFPQDFRGLLDLVDTGKLLFEELPEEERTKYADFADFVMNYETPVAPEEPEAPDIKKESGESE